MCAGGCGFDSGGGSGDDDDDVVDAGGATADASGPTFDGAPEPDAGDPDAMATPDAGGPDAAPNTAPTIGAIEDQTTKSAAVGPLDFTVGDAETPVGSLVVSAVSSDQAVVPDANLALGGADADRTITVTPVASGTVTVTVTVDDGADTASETFTVDVTNAPPVATADDYAAIGNSELTVAAGAGVLANDDDSDADELAAVADTIATSEGGSVTLAADGGFVYRPPVGVTATTDTFDYQVTDGFELDTATVSISLSSMVWYVDNSVAASGDGRSHAPFQALAEAQAASGAGDILYVHTGDGTSAHQNAGIVLQNGQSLIGEGVALVVDSISLVAAGTPPVIGNASGNGVTLSSASNVVRGLTIRDAQLAGVAGPSIVDVRLEDLTIERSRNRAIDIGNNIPSGTITVRIRNNVIRGNLADFTTTTTGIDVDVRGSAGGRLDAEIRDNEIRGVYVGVLVATYGTTGTSGGVANSVTIRGNDLIDIDDDGIQLESRDTAATDYTVVDNTMDGVAALGSTPARGIDLRVLTTAGGATSAVVENNTIADMGLQCASFVGSGASNGGTLTLRVANNTISGCTGEGLFMAPNGALQIYATVDSNVLTDNGNPASFEFFAGTTFGLDLNLVDNDDDVGFRLERHDLGALRLGGSLGQGGSFDDDNGNIAANGNQTAGAAPAVVVFTTASSPRQIQIIDPATIPVP